MREDFTPATVKRIAQKAMYICANEGCLRFTGYGTTEGNARAIADAAHIAPASASGPRASSGGTADPRTDEANGIWLCKICHKKIDDDPGYYPDDLLRRWKRDQEEVVRRIVGKDIEAALLELRNAKRYHQECREVLAFFDTKRVFYEGLDHEFPPRVLASIDLIRARIGDVRARVAPDSELFVVLGEMQDAAKRFLKNIGKETDLESLRCDSRDPRWLRFSDELQKFRRELNILLRPLADTLGYRLTWLFDADDAV